MNERMEALVSGRVQMVLYRDYAKKQADRIGVVGEVKNLPDRTVWVAAEGTPEKLQRFLNRLWKGPLFAKVEDIQVSWCEPRGTYEGFVIHFDE